MREIFKQILENYNAFDSQLKISIAPLEQKPWNIGKTPSKSKRKLGNQSQANIIRKEKIIGNIFILNEFID